MNFCNEVSMKPHPRTAERYSLDEGGQALIQKRNWFKLNGDPNCQMCLWQRVLKATRPKDPKPIQKLFPPTQDSGSDGDWETMCRNFQKEGAVNSILHEKFKFSPPLNKILIVNCFSIPHEESNFPPLLSKILIVVLGKTGSRYLNSSWGIKIPPLNTILIVVLAKKGAVKLSTPSEQETSFFWKNGDVMIYDVTSILH